MGAVTDRSTVGLAELKSALGVTIPDYDDQLDAALVCAKEAADNYLNNPFLERDEDDPAEYVEPEVELPIPQLVEKGVIAYSAALFAADIQQQQAIASIISGGAPPVPFGAVLTNVTTGALSVGFGYPTTGGSSGSGVTDPLDSIRQRFWSRYRLIPGARGASSSPNRVRRLSLNTYD